MKELQSIFYLPNGSTEHEAITYVQNEQGIKAFNRLINNYKEIPYFNVEVNGLLASIRSKKTNELLANISLNCM